MAFLLRKKTSFLNHRIFQLILSITGTAELGFGSSVITNVGVFQHILCNFEVNWRLVTSPKEAGMWWYRKLGASSKPSESASSTVKVVVREKTTEALELRGPAL